MGNLKCWHFFAGLGFLALMFSIFFPVFAVAHSYSGPSMGTARIAQAIDEVRTKTGRWPTDFEQIRPLLRRRNTWRSYSVSFFAIKASPEAAEYVVAVNGNAARYRTKAGRLAPLPDEIIQGVLPARTKS